MNELRLSNPIGTYAAALIVLVVATGTGAAPIRAEREDACTDTANAALQACQHEAANDFWLGVGKCENLANESAGDACEDATGSARREALDECDAQLDARNEICGALGEAPFDPRINPAKFVNPAAIGTTVAANPYLPLIRGRVWTYASASEQVTVTVANESKSILGVRCAVVRDVVREDGQLVEDTTDWLAQDVYGNVWYFGEISKSFENGDLVSLEGSWKAGVDGAKPGILMKALPVVGAIYRQEFLLGDAEDMAEVIGLAGSATVPAASCQGTCLITKEFTPLSPGSIEHKYYAPGIGLILEVDSETGDRLELVQGGR
jgi:hypothetical protein